MLNSFAPILLAPIIGSFMGVLIRRIPDRRPLFLSRSCCEYCFHKLTPGELIPLVSFALLRGRCSACRRPIPPFHIAVELLAVAVAIWSFLAMSDPEMAWLTCLLGWTLLVLGWIDWRHMMLPDLLTLPLILAGLGATWLLSPPDLVGHALGAVIGYLCFRAVDGVYYLLRGRTGIGQGDAKLLAAAGAWLGWSALPAVITGGAVIGLCYAATVRLQGEKIGPASAIPFGPPLCAAFWLAWLYYPG